MKFLAAGTLLALALFASIWWMLVGFSARGKLIAHWTASNQGRDSEGKSSGSLTGKVTIVSSEAGPMFSFESARAEVVVTNAPQLNFGAGQDFSITARIQPLQTNTSFGVMSIVDKREINGILAARGYSLHLEYGKLGCQLAPAAQWPTKPADFSSLARFKAWWQRRKTIVPMTFASYVSTGPDLCDGKFHDVALTVERVSTNGGRLYVDGEVVLTFDPTKQAASLANTAPLLIGGHPDTTLNCGFQGKIGEVRLYSRALMTNEVKTLAKNPALAGPSARN